MSDLIRNGGTVVLLRDRDVPEATLQEAVRLLQRHPGPLHFEVHPKALFLPRRTLTRDELYGVARTARKERKLSATAFVCVLTQQPDEYGWFADVDPDDPSIGFLHVDDWRWIIDAPPPAITAYLLLTNVFAGAAVSVGLDVETVAHTPSIGCIGDMCADKSDLALGLRTADICGRCLGHLEAAGAIPELLRQVVSILDECRAGSLSTARYRPQSQVFAAWPYPIAVTRHKAANARDPLHRFTLLLDHFDGLVKYVAVAASATGGHRLTITATQSLGTWVETLRTVPLAGEAEKRRAKLMEPAWKLVAIRNEYAHGHAAEHTDVYAARIVAIESLLTPIEDAALAMMHGWKPVIPTNVSFENGYRIVGDCLLGSNVLFQQFETTLPDGNALRVYGYSGEKRVYLCNDAMDRFVSLHPFILRSECPECRQSRVLIADEQPGQNSRYLDPLIGHRVRVTAEGVTSP